MLSTFTNVGTTAGSAVQTNSARESSFAIAQSSSSARLAVDRWAGMINGSVGGWMMDRAVGWVHQLHCLQATSQ